MRLIAAMEVAAAGFHQAIFIGKRFKIRHFVRAVAGVAALYAAQAMLHTVLYDPAQSGIVALILERMRQHRDASCLAYDLHRTFNGEEAARQPVFLTLFNIPVKSVLHAVRKSQLHKHLRKVRAAYHAAEAAVHLVIAYRNTVGCHKLGHFPVALISVVHDPVEHRPQPVRLRIYIISEYMYGAAVLRAYLYPRHDLYAELLAGFGSLGIAGYRVMIGHRDSGKANIRGKPDGLAPGRGSVRCGGVYMQVYLLHPTIFFLHSPHLA